MIGKRFHSLVVAAQDRPYYWRCICDCGGQLVAYGSNLRLGKTKSCGCLRRATAAARVQTHGLSGTPEYKIWTGIQSRCYNAKTNSFSIYGAAGITMCDRWKHSFENFYKDMGPRPSPNHSVDRKDSKGNYEPENCRWATSIEQGNNTSANVFVTYQGERLTTANFARKIGFDKGTVWRWVSRDKLTMDQIEARIARRRHMFSSASLR